MKPKYSPADVLDYVIETEHRDYVQNDEPDGHVYALAVRFRPIVAAAPELLAELKNVLSNVSLHPALRDKLNALVARAEGASDDTGDHGII